MSWFEICLRFIALLGACCAATWYGQRRPATSLLAFMIALAIAVSLGVNVGIGDYLDGQR